MQQSVFPPDLPPTRVLVVDPSERVRKIFQDALNGMGCEMVFAKDGFEALWLASEHMPSLVFTNAELDKMDGYKLSEIFSKHKNFKLTTPVVVMSHDPDIFQKARSRIVGAREHLAHPLDIESVREAFFRNS